MCKSETSQQMLNASITLHHIPCWVPLKSQNPCGPCLTNKKKVQGILELLIFGVFDPTETPGPPAGQVHAAPVGHGPGPEAETRYVWDVFFFQDNNHRK